MFAGLVAVVGGTRCAMQTVDAVLDEVYVAQERVSRSEICRRAAAAKAPAPMIDALDALPEGEYSQEEVAEALGLLGVPDRFDGQGVPAADLADDDLLRELAELHRTRNATLRNASRQALERHSERTLELEREYLLRFPDREVDPQRLRGPARERGAESTGPAESTEADAAAMLAEASEPDFAAEHGSTTLVGEVENGPEHVAEPESPKGLSGQD